MESSIRRPLSCLALAACYACIVYYTYARTYNLLRTYAEVLPYSGKLSREKTFAFFAVSEESTKVFSAKFVGEDTICGRG